MQVFSTEFKYETITTVFSGYEPFIGQLTYWHLFLSLCLDNILVFKRHSYI